MTTQATQTDHSLLDASIDELQLTLKTARLLKAQGIERIGELVEQTSRGIDVLRLERKRAIEVRDVLTSRGL